MAKTMSKDMGIPYRVLDIDDEQKEMIADGLVRKYGDDSKII
jgi:hypothetical protein